MGGLEKMKKMDPNNWTCEIVKFWARVIYVCLQRNDNLLIKHRKKAVANKTGGPIYYQVGLMQN